MLMVNKDYHIVLYNKDYWAGLQAGWGKLSPKVFTHSDFKEGERR